MSLIVPRRNKTIATRKDGTMNPTGYGYTTDAWGNNGKYGYTYTDGFGSRTDGNGKNRFGVNGW